MTGSHDPFSLCNKKTAHLVVILWSHGGRCEVELADGQDGSVDRRLPLLGVLLPKGGPHLEFPEALLEAALVF